MRKLITFLIVALAMQTVAQVPTWQWAKKGGGYEHDWANGFAMDASGNMYVIGSSNSPSITFDTITLTPPATPGKNLFIVKYDINRKAVWAKSTGCMYSEKTPSGIAVDANGNSYITGSFNCPTVNFGSFTLTHSPGPSDNMFVVKYDTNGNVLWAKSAGGTSTNGSMPAIGNDVSIDASGNAYVTGSFYTPDIVFGNDTLINAGAILNDMFIVKYDPNGNVLWAESAGNSSSDSGNSIVTDASGNSYLTGNFAGVTITLGGVTLTSAGGTDVFTAKYDTNGNVLWAKSVGGGKDDSSGGIAIDASGNSYVTGNFSDSITNIGSTTLTSAGIQDLFIVKYDASGNVVWASSAGGDKTESSLSIAIDSGGNSYITGWFNSDSFPFATYHLNASQGQISCLFVLKYDAVGNKLWAQAAWDGPYSETEGRDILVDGAGSIYITGFFNGDLCYFGNLSLNNTNPVYSSKQKDMFIWKLCSGTVVLPTITANGPTTFCQGDSVTLTASSATAYLWDDSFFSTSTAQSIVVKKQNALEVRAIAADGCSALSEVTIVTVNPLPDTTIQANGSTTFCKGNSVTLSGGFAKSWLWSNGDTTASTTLSSPQIIQLSITSFDGCIATSSPKIITVNPLPPVPTITASGPTTFCYEDSVILTSSTSDYYNWSNGYITKSITVSSSERDSVKVFDSNGCSATSLPVTITVKYPTYSQTQYVTACNSYTSHFGKHTWTASGTYFDTIPNAGVSGCDSILSINLTINSALYTIAYDKGSKTFTLTVNAFTLANAISYHWDFGDGTSANLPTPSHNYTKDSTYTLCMKIYTAAGDSCEYCHIIGIDSLGNIIRTPGFTVKVVNITVGIQGQNTQPVLTVYPNPFMDQTTIQFSEAQQNTVIKITDVLGKVIKEINFTGKELILEKGMMQAGIYFITVSGEKKDTVNKKIIVQ
jgi:hypothetical protein